MDTEMLIGATFEKGTEAGEPVLNPKTGAAILDLRGVRLGQFEDGGAGLRIEHRLAGLGAFLELRADQHFGVHGELP